MVNNMNTNFHPPNPVKSCPREAVIKLAPHINESPTRCKKKKRSLASNVVEIPKFQAIDIPSTKKKKKIDPFSSADFAAKAAVINTTRSKTLIGGKRGQNLLPLWDVVVDNTNDNDNDNANEAEMEREEYLRNIQTILELVLDDLFTTTRTKLITNSTTAKSTISQLKKLYSGKLQRIQLMQSITEFFIFCHERQQIWYRKCKLQSKRRFSSSSSSSSSSSWTKDDILSTRHFTNVYRELDTGTQYLRRHAIHIWNQCKKQQQHQHHEQHQQQQYTQQQQSEQQYSLQILWSCICYRLVNRIETFDDIGGIPSMNDFRKYKLQLNKLQKDKKTVFTAAHQNMGMRRYWETLNALSKNNFKSLRGILGSILNASKERDLKGCTEILRGIDNIGPFFAWQITCDLMELNVIDKDCFTEIDWVQLGPGAKSGLNLIFQKNGKINDIDLCTFLEEHQQTLFDHLGVNFIQFDNRPMSLKDIEHALCEFSKYVNVSYTYAKSKSTHNVMRGYVPREECSLDSKQSCANCDVGNIGSGSGGSRCDTCASNYCSRCVADMVSDALNTFICDECKDLGHRINKEKLTYWM